MQKILDAGCGNGEDLSNKSEREGVGILNRDSEMKRMLTLN